MKHNFQLPDFPNSHFAIETSIWNGRAKLFMNDSPVEQSNEIGKPFLIPTTEGGFIKAFARQSITGFFVPALEINGKQNHIVEKLKWFQYAIGGLPLLLLFGGGAVGGAIGAIGSVTIFSIFIKEGAQIPKYLKAIGVVATSFILYFLFVTFVWKLIY